MSNEIGNVVGGVTSNAANEARGFIKVLTDFNIVGFALGVLMANAGKDLTNSIIDGIIMPTLQPAINRITPKGKTSIRIGSIEINLEKIISALIKFSALTLVVYLLIKVGINMSKPITWVSVRSVAEGVSL